MGEVTLPDKGNESASIIERDGRKIKENKLHSHKNRLACPPNVVIKSKKKLLNYFYF
jgi:hypothetical protein